MFIELGNISLSKALFILTPIFFVTRDFLTFCGVINLLCLPIFMSLGMISVGLLEFLNYCGKKEPQKSKETWLINLEILGVENVQKKKDSAFFLTMLFTFLCGLLDILTWLPFLFIKYYEKDKTIKNLPELFKNAKLFEIIFVLIFYSLIMKTKIYRHHLLALGIIITSNIALGLICKLYFSWEMIWFAYFLGERCLHSLKEVTEVWIMRKRQVTPYFMIFYEGIIEFICSIGIWAFMSKNFFDFHVGEKIKTLYFIMLLIAYVILSGLYNLFVQKINFRYSPSHRIITDYAGILFLYIFEEIKNKNKNKKEISTYEIVLEIIISIFIILSVLVYNEIFILNFCSLQEDTSKYIVKRGKEEVSEDIKVDEPLIDPNNMSLRTVDTF